ncbi:AP-4 complex subunit epsilon [Pelomyxa schiedti]|nr:AP-4 complex subunit epsilon [Pelomyxa schiedti]
MQMLGWGGKDFFELVRDIGEARSKEEEQRVMGEEVERLKVAFSKPETDARKVKENLVRLMYCEMLGFDASFGHIAAMNATQHARALNKRTGYLAVTLCLHEDHPLAMMTTNSLRKGLESPNYLEVCAALTAMTRLLTETTVPAFTNIIKAELLTHKRPAVRQKAVMAALHIWKKDRSSIDIDATLRASLCDTDPCVMAATLCAMQEIVKQDPDHQHWVDLVPSLVHLLWQVVDHHLPRAYDFHGIPAPWVQVHLLELLGILGKDNRKTSEQIYEVVGAALAGACSIVNNASFAIVYECIRTITKIYPKPDLLTEITTKNISKMMASRDYNLKYLGIKALTSLVKLNPAYATEHQLVLLDCLESEDETLRRETLDLLYLMTNSKNVVSVVSKLLEHLQTSSDTFFRKDLVLRITQLSERYAPNHQWYLHTMTTLFQVGGSLVKSDIANNLLRLIAEEGSDGDEGLESGHGSTLQKYAAEWFFKQLQSLLKHSGATEMPEVLIQVTSWVLGEYGDLCGVDMEKVILSLCDLFDLTTESRTKSVIASALLKAICHSGREPSSQAETLFSGSRHSFSLDLQQRCYEALALMKNPSVMVRVLPKDASCEDIEVDPRLAFLDHFTRSLPNPNGQRYIPKAQRSLLHTSSHTVSSKSATKLHFEYPAPSVPGEIQTAPPPPSTVQITQTVHPTSSVSSVSSSTLSMMSSSSKKSPWTLGGYGGVEGTKRTEAEEEVEPVTPVATPTPVVTPTSTPSKRTMFPTPITNPTRSAQANELFGSTDPTVVKPDMGTGNFPRRGISSTYTPASMSVASQPTPKMVNLLYETDKNTSPKGITELLSNAPSSLLELNQTEVPISKYATNMGPSALFEGVSMAEHVNSTEVELGTTTHNTSLVDLLSAGPLQQLPTEITPGHSLSLIQPTLATEKQGFLSQVQSGSKFTPDNLIPISSLQNEVPNFEQATFIRVAADPTLCVQYTKALKEDSITFILLLSNAAIAPISNVVLQLDPSPGLQAFPVIYFRLFLKKIKVQCVAGSSEITCTANSFTVRSLPPKLTALEIIRIQPSYDTKFASISSLGGQVTYTSRQSKTLTFSIPIDILNLFRPNVITTDAFGKMWGTHKAEKKQRIPAPANISQAVEMLCKALNAHCVQIIGAEAIICSKVICTTNSCLIHARHEQIGTVPAMMVTIRAVEPTLPDTLMQALVNSMEKLRLQRN